jgi:hypothetical protein
MAAPSGPKPKKHGIAPRHARFRPVPT